MRRPRTSRPPLLALLALAAACQARAPAALSHEAYVWQRSWTPEVSAAVAAPPPQLAALHVLALEYSGPSRAEVEPAVDLAALARSGRPVVAVVRIDGTAPLDGLRLTHLAALAQRWRDAGVPVRGVEVDHDCAASRLPAYAAWLRAERPVIGALRLSITALPSWANADPGALVAAADEVTLQVHAVQAPALFDPAEARRRVEAWARATHRPFRVAVPTYRVRLAADRRRLQADPAEVSGFVAGLARHPVEGVTGVCWFRLGNGADPDAWSPRTLAAVLRGDPLAPRFAVRLRPAAGGAADVVVENAGEVDAPAPSPLSLSGRIDALDGVRGYAPARSSLVARDPPRVRAGEQLTVGWVRGSGVTVDAP